MVLIRAILCKGYLRTEVVLDYVQEAVQHVMGHWNCCHSGNKLKDLEPIGPYSGHVRNICIWAGASPTQISLIGGIFAKPDRNKLISMHNFKLYQLIPGKDWLIKWVFPYVIPVIIVQNRQVQCPRFPSNKETTGGWRLQSLIYYWVGPRQPLLLQYGL